MNSPFPRLIPVVAAFCLSAPALSRAQDDWQEAGRTLFDYYADAMVGKNYSTFINSCESKSRSLFREFTLWQMDLMSDDDLMRVLPSDEQGRPISLKELIEMDDNKFWAVYTESMRKREMAVGEAAYKQLGQSGLPAYKLKVLTKYNEAIYMIVERVYAKPTPVPIPLTVLEAIKEEGKWRLVLPREIMWDAMEAGRNRQMELQRAAAALPYDVKPPLKPTADSPVKIPGSPDAKPAK
ncbi:MAG: hypothetical protein V4726_08645 [Verrucomicrobiota bacterium]